MKYILPFIDSNNYQSNSNCSMCDDIDMIYRQILNYDNYESDKCQEKINELEKWLVDGYKLLPVIEKRIDAIDVVKEFSLLKNVEQGTIARYNEFIKGIECTNKDDKACTLHSRWCCKCAARKFDIYDTLCKERMDLLPITNFFISLPNLSKTDKEAEMYIIWRDSSTENFAYAELVINNRVVVRSFVKNEYEHTPFKYSIKANVLNTIYVVNYDCFNVELVRTPLKYIIAETDNKDMPDEIDNVAAVEETRLVRSGFHYEREKVIKVNYTYDKNKVVEVRRALNGVPDNEHYGLEVLNNEVVVDEAERNTWYFKLFPRSEQRARKFNSGYRLYYDYNYDSAFALVHLSELVKDVNVVKVTPNSKQIEINWSDPVLNWSKTQVLIKPTGVINPFNNNGKILRYNGSFSKDFLHHYPKIFEDYIMDVRDGIVVCESTKKDEYKNKPFIINELNGYEIVNGQTYQVAIVPFSEKGVATIPFKQHNVRPLYIRPAHIINKECLLDYMGFFNIDENDYLYTSRSTIGWFEARYPLVEGGVLSFELSSNYPVRLRIYVNKDNVFDNVQQSNEIYRNKKVKIMLNRMTYCKVIFQIDIRYPGTRLSISNIELRYKRYIEDDIGAKK